MLPPDDVMDADPIYRELMQPREGDKWQGIETSRPSLVMSVNLTALARVCNHYLVHGRPSEKPPRGILADMEKKP